MAMIVLVLGVISLIGLCIRQICSRLRQRDALQSLERLAEHHPECAEFVAGIVTAASPERDHSKKKLRRHA
jgi:hypothetical protein